MSRENIQAWPLFRSRQLPSDLNVLTIEMLCNEDASIEEAVRTASGVLRDGLSRALGEHHPFWLVVAQQPSHNPGRLTTRLREKRKMWSYLEERFRLPSGTRLESPVNYPDNYHGYGGWLNFSADGLPDALEVARRENAVCVGAESGEVDDLCENILLAATPTHTRWNLFLASIGLLSRTEFAMRSYGAFDDRQVGVELFAFDPLLDKVETAISEGDAGIV